MIHLVDIQLISAMGPPGGGRNAVTSRFLRHFNIFSINAFSDETMVRIFSSMVVFYLKINEFPPEYFSVGNQIVTATLEVSAPIISHALVIIKNVLKQKDLVNNLFSSYTFILCHL